MAASLSQHRTLSSRKLACAIARGSGENSCPSFAKCGRTYSGYPTSAPASSRASCGIENVHSADGHTNHDRKRPHSQRTWCGTLALLNLVPANSTSRPGNATKRDVNAFNGLQRHESPTRFMTVPRSAAGSDDRMECPLFAVGSKACTGKRLEFTSFIGKESSTWSACCGFCS